MPSMLRINQDPPKVYFSASEACKILDCSKAWLKYWTAVMGYKVGSQGGGWRRYSVKELNKLAEIRKMTSNGIRSNSNTRQLAGFKTEPKQGSGSLETQNDAVPESENRPEL